MSSVVFLGDTHFGVRNDNQVFIDYYKKFYDDVFFPYIDKHEISTIIQFGDLVDRRKYINFLTLHSMREMFFEPIKERRIETHIFCGNHDVYYKNTNHINSLDELLGGYGGLVQFYTNPVTIDVCGVQFCILPWINGENYAASMETITSTDARYCLGHLELAGFEMYRGVANEQGMDSNLFANKFDLTISGHFHHRSERNSIIYVGTPYEMTWQDYDDPKGFHIFDTEKGKLTFVENPYKIFHKIYYDDAIDVKKMDFSLYKSAFVKVIVKKKENPIMFEKMMDKLYEIGPADVSILEELNFGDEMDSEHVQEKSTLDILSEAIDSLTTDKNKDKMKSYVHEIYLDALNAEG